MEMSQLILCEILLIGASLLTFGVYELRTASQKPKG